MAKFEIKRLPDRPQPPSGPIRRFDAPALGPHHSPPRGTLSASSNDVAAKAVRIAKNPPGINPTQQRF